MIAVYDKLIYFNEASKYTILRMLSQTACSVVK